MKTPASNRLWAVNLLQFAFCVYFLNPLIGVSIGLGLYACTCICYAIQNLKPKDDEEK